MPPTTWRILCTSESCNVAPCLDIIYAKYDMTFLPEFSAQVVEEFQKHNLGRKAAMQPCRHYSMGGLRTST